MKNIDFILSTLAVTEGKSILKPAVCVFVCGSFNITFNKLASFVSNWMSLSITIDVEMHTVHRDRFR